jgi:hypothetical protein
MVSAAKLPANAAQLRRLDLALVFTRSGRESRLVHRVRCGARGVLRASPIVSHKTVVEGRPRPLPPPQAARISCYSVAEEILPGRADFLVELRGFEPMAIAGAARSRVGSRPVGFARPLKAALGGGFAFRLDASRYPGKRKDLRCHLSLRSRRRKETKVSTENTGIPMRRHPEELPMDH